MAELTQLGSTSQFHSSAVKTWWKHHGFTEKNKRFSIVTLVYQRVICNHKKKEGSVTENRDLPLWNCFSNLRCNGTVPIYGWFPHQHLHVYGISNCHVWLPSWKLIASCPCYNLSMLTYVNHGTKRPRMVHTYTSTDHNNCCFLLNVSLSSCWFYTTTWAWWIPKNILGGYLGLSPLGAPSSSLPKWFIKSFIKPKSA